MKPKVLLIVLPYVVKNIDASMPKVRSFLALPYGLLSVATYNKDLADITILDLNDSDESHHDILVRTMVEDMKPDIVGFSMMFDNSYRHLKPLLQLVKDYDDDILTLLGGAAASYSYEEILREQGLLDLVCYSEGERPFRNLLQNKPNHAWKWREKNADPLPSFVDLDDVIDIDYSFVHPESYAMEEAFSPSVDHRKHKQFFVVTSRGCPFKCIFCSNAKIHGQKMRFASIDKIIAHVDRLVKQYAMDVLTIYDDQLLINQARAKELFRRLIPYRLRIECPNGLSPAFIDDELAGLMAEAGLDTAYLAIEHGTEKMLKVIQKPLKLSQVAPAVDALHKYGIFVHGFFVMGLPGETDEDRRETTRFIKEVKLDWAGLNMATPVRGSRLYDLCIENGWIQKQRIDEIVDKKYIINIPGIDPAYVEREVYLMNLDVNFVNNRRMAIEDYKTAAACFKDVIRRYGDHAFAYNYLAECQLWLKQPISESVNKFYDIIDENPVWKDYADHFGISGTLVKR